MFQLNRDLSDTIKVRRCDRNQFTRPVAELNENRSESNENKRPSTDHRDHDRHTVKRERTPLISKTENQINQTEQTETEAGGGEK